MSAHTDASEFDQSCCQRVRNKSGQRGQFTAATALPHQILTHTCSQGLITAAGGLECVQTLLSESEVLLAAHGPYTAAGVAKTLGLDVPCVGRNFGTFDGVVAELERHFSDQES